MFKPVVLKAEANDAVIAAAPDNQQGFARFAHLNYLAKDVAKQINDIRHYEVEVSSSNISVDIYSTRGILDFEFAEGFAGDVDLFNVYLSTYNWNGDYTPVPDNYYIQATVYSNGTVVPVLWVAGYAPNAHIKIKNLNTEENDWGTRFYVYYELVKIS